MWFSAMTLSQDQIDFFWENGYLPYNKVLSDEELALYRCEYDLEFEKAWEKDQVRNLAVDDGQDLETKKSAPQQMLQIMQMSDRNIHYRKLIYNDAILDAVQDVIGPNLMLFHDQALFKPAHTGGAVFWHQDNAYWKCRPATLVSCWLTLDDVTVENGAMQVIPGSHLKPVWHPPSQATTALFNIEDQVDTSKAVAINLPAGSCMFHHCQTLHYTQPNETDRQRRAFAIHFMQPGTRDGDGNVFHTGYSRPVLRTGY
jgi:phytanoyl-CoA hydroxylase